MECETGPGLSCLDVKIDIRTFRNDPDSAPLSIFAASAEDDCKGHIKVKKMNFTARMFNISRVPAQVKIALGFRSAQVAQRKQE